MLEKNQLRKINSTNETIKIKIGFLNVLITLDQDLYLSYKKKKALEKIQGLSHKCNLCFNPISDQNPYLNSLFLYFPPLPHYQTG